MSVRFIMFNIRWATIRLGLLEQITGRHKKENSEQ